MNRVTLPAGGLAELRRAIEEIAAPDGVRALREAGRHLAGDAEVAITEAAGGPLAGLAGLAVDKFWNELSRYFDQAGWGRLEHELMRDGVGAIVSRDWAEADPTEARDVPGCHLSTGLLAELLTRAAGPPVAVMEVQCRSRGDQACRFLFGSPTTLLVVHRKLSDSESLNVALAALG